MKCWIRNWGTCCVESQDWAWQFGLESANELTQLSDKKRCAPYAPSPLRIWFTDRALISAIAVSMRVASLSTNPVRCPSCSRGNLPAERRNHTREYRT